MNIPEPKLSGEGIIFPYRRYGKTIYRLRKGQWVVMQRMPSKKKAIRKYENLKGRFWE